MQQQVNIIVDINNYTLSANKVNKQDLSIEELYRICYLYLMSEISELVAIDKIDDQLIEKRLISYSCSRNYNKIKDMRGNVLELIPGPIDITYYLYNNTYKLYISTSPIEKVASVYMYDTNKVYQNIISELVNELSIEDLPTFLACDNELIRKAAKQRFDKLNKGIK